MLDILLVFVSQLTSILFDGCQYKIFFHRISKKIVICTVRVLKRDFFWINQVCNASFWIWKPECPEFTDVIRSSDTSTNIVSI